MKRAKKAWGEAGQKRSAEEQAHGHDDGAEQRGAEQDFGQGSEQLGPGTL